jgi:hypothetical protein
VTRTSIEPRLGGVSFIEEPEAPEIYRLLKSLKLLAAADSSCLTPPTERPRGREMTEEDPEQEHSDFAGEFTDDGVTVLVDIFRPAGSTGGWSLEVIDQDEGLTVWEEPFATDQEAFEEFLATVERDGIRSFLEEPETKLH